jgi:hypothetical protein
MGLIPFDINKAEAGATVVTRNGRKVRILCTDRLLGKSYTRPIIALVPENTIDNEQSEEVISYLIDGTYHGSAKKDGLDLMIKEPEIWGLMCKKGGRVFTFNITFETKEQALRQATRMLYNWKPFRILEE